jgi:enoyl-[acyl-carrier protein] reductase II
VKFVVDQGVRFVTTSAGDPSRYCAELKEAGLTVFHVVPTLKAALKAVEAGVDGLIVEGAEGGGFKNQRDVASMVLLPLVCSKVKVPVIAAGGYTDGRSMAAAFALGAEGIQMGTRMLSSAESPAHMNWKQAIVGAQETDTVFLNRGGQGPALRALRTERTTRIEAQPPENMRAEFAGVLDLYFGGDMEAAVPLTGQVCGRIEAVKTVSQILQETVNGFREVVTGMGRYTS